MQYYEKKVRKHLFFEGNIFFWLGRIDYFANYPYLCTMKTLLDVHTHTIASGHAYSSLQEMTLAAKEKGLEILGITEHGPNRPLQLRCMPHERPADEGIDAQTWHSSGCHRYHRALRHRPRPLAGGIPRHRGFCKEYHQYDPYPPSRAKGRQSAWLYHRLTDGQTDRSKIENRIKKLV